MIEFLKNGSAMTKQVINPSIVFAYKGVAAHTAKFVMTKNISEEKSVPPAILLMFLFFPIHCPTNTANITLPYVAHMRL
jgi:hypothetical protein